MIRSFMDRSRVVYSFSYVLLRLIRFCFFLPAAPLSGGEFQKVTLARSLAQEPKLLLLDEPTSNLNPRNQHDVLNTISNIAHEHNICVMIVIHDLNLAVRYCDKFLFLKDAKVYAYGGLEVMTPETIRNVYGMDAAIINHGQIPVIIPFPDEKRKVVAN